jgi:glycogen operon protein
MQDYLSKGMPDLSYHGKRAWYGDFESFNRQVGILYSGYYTGEETLYVIYNMQMSEQELALPTLPGGQSWQVLADTERENDVFREEEQPLENQKMIRVAPRTIMVLAGK